jgi:anti-sigma B factor antagonist
MKPEGTQTALPSEVRVVINVRQVGNATVLDLDGSLKLGEPVDTLRGQVQELLGAGTKNLAFNLSRVPDVDSSGIGALLHAYTMTKEVGGKCKFFAAPKRVLQVLKMVRLDKVFELAEDEATSLAGF